MNISSWCQFTFANADTLIWITAVTKTQTPVMRKLVAVEDINLSTLQVNRNKNDSQILTWMIPDGG